MSGAEVWREPPRGGYPDPAILALSGRERLQRWQRENWLGPPLTHLTGARPTAIGDGTAEAVMPASRWLLNSAGLLSGGTLAILADIAFGCAVETKLPAATPYTTAELSLTFVRPARPESSLSAHGQAIHVGRSVGLSEAFVIAEGEERLIAHGTSRLAVLPRLEHVPEPRDREPDPEPEYDSPDPYLRPAPLEGVLGADVWRELSGIEVMRRQIAGELPPPPVHWLTGLSLVEVAEERATMRMPASEWLNSPTGLLQGGTLVMLADAAMLSATLTSAPAGTAIAGLDLKVNFLRPAPADGRDLLARAEVEHHGRTLAICRARIENADGKAVALATGSAMYLHDRTPDLDADVELSGGGGSG